MAKQTIIWQYSGLSDFALPGGVPADALRGIRRIWRTAVSAVRGSGADPEEREQGERPAPEVLSELLPELDIEAAATALEEALEERSDPESPKARPRVLVGPPGSGTKEVLQALARRRGWAEVAPPPRARLRERESAVAERLSERGSRPDGPAVIPELHRWLLRSARGLPHIRRLLERLRDPGAPLLVGCDSWAWSFLDRTLGVGDLVGEPLALAALDAPGLASWLGPPLESRGLVCRSTEREDDSVVDEGESPTLVKLARAARGNPGVALELWRRSLTVASDRENTLWVAPVGDSEVAVLGKLASSHEIVLHALLLHGGLERELLPAILPFPRHEVLRRLRDLRELGLVIERGGELSVSLAASASVRQLLESEGFLVDDF